MLEQVPGLVLAPGLLVLQGQRVLLAPVLGQVQGLVPVLRVRPLLALSVLPFPPPKNLGKRVGEVLSQRGRGGPLVLLPGPLLWVLPALLVVSFRLEAVPVPILPHTIS